MVDRCSQERSSSRLIAGGHRLRTCCCGASRGDGDLLHALGEAIQFGGNLRGVGRGQLGHRVVEYVPVELLELSGFLRSTPNSTAGRTAVIAAPTSPPIRATQPITVPAAPCTWPTQASSGAGGHHRNHRTRITEQIPLRTGMGRVGSAGPDAVHEGPALQSQVRPVRAITGICQNFVRARHELLTRRRRPRPRLGSLGSSNRHVRYRHGASHRSLPQSPEGNTIARPSREISISRKTEHSKRAHWPANRLTGPQAPSACTTERSFCARPATGPPVRRGAPIGGSARDLPFGGRLRSAIRVSTPQASRYRVW